MRRRVISFFAAALLLIHVALFPATQAKAAAAALTAVGAAITVAAFLNACGIYPYLQDSSFGEWGAQNLADLWSQYISSFEGGQTPSGGTVETFNTIKSFVVGNTLAVASATWGELRSFASWIVSKFSVTDNQTGVELGSYSGSSLPVFSSAPSYDGLVSAGFSIGPRAGDSLAYPIFLGANVDGVFAYYEPSSLNPNMIRFVSLSPAIYYYTDVWRPTGESLRYEVGSFNIGGPVYASGGALLGYYSGSVILVASLPDGVLEFGSPASALAYFSDYVPTFSGVIADTSTVSVPDALPEGSQFGGLRVVEAPATSGAPAIADVIEGGVELRAQPVVEIANVDVEAGTDVDSETGAITDNPVVITPDDSSYSDSDFQIPDLSTVWPFSIPWDLYRVYQAFDADPVPPYFSITFASFPGVEGSVSLDISIPDSMRPTFDGVAEVVRSFALVIACIGFAVWLGKYIDW